MRHCWLRVLLHPVCSRQSTTQTLAPLSVLTYVLTHGLNMCGCCQPQGQEVTRCKLTENQAVQEADRSRTPRSAGTKPLCGEKARLTS